MCGFNLTPWQLFSVSKRFVWSFLAFLSSFRPWQTRRTQLLGPHNWDTSRYRRKIHKTWMIFCVTCSNGHFFFYFNRISYKRGSKIRSRNAEHSWAIFLEREEKICSWREENTRRNLFLYVSLTTISSANSIERHIQFISD
jgi:hypothetical protein